MNAPPVTDERDGLLSFLDQQRQAVCNAVYGLNDDQARRAPTASTLSLGGLIKHLAYAERTWLARIQQSGGVDDPPALMAEYMASFALDDGETLDGVLATYRQAAAQTDAASRSIDDLDRPVPLPPAPWYPQRCTVRWVLLHLIEETARHAGHADLIRETLDGALSGPLMAAAEGWPDTGWVKPWRPDPGPAA